MRMRPGIGQRRLLRLRALIVLSLLVLGAGRPHLPASGPLWQVVPSPNPSIMPLSNDALYAVSALADNDVWAVGRFSNTSGNNINQTVIEHWDGTQWRIVPSPNVGTQGSELFGVAALSDHDVWAVGDYVVNGASLNDHPLIEHYNGTTWSVVPSPNPNPRGDNLTAVAAISSSNVWAVGYQFGLTPLVLHWNGTAWSVVTAGLGAAGGHRPGGDQRPLRRRHLGGRRGRIRHQPRAALGRHALERHVGHLPQRGAGIAGRRGGH